MTAALGLFIAHALLQGADAATTIAILGRGGREANPAMRWLMRKLGLIPALAAAKLALCGAALWALGQPFAVPALAVLAAIQAVTVANNMLVLKDLRNRP